MSVVECMNTARPSRFLLTKSRKRLGFTIMLSFGDFQNRLTL